jgi:GNAT superfamily N-acetyltransferase
VRQAIKNGGALMFTFAGEDVAVALINPRVNVLTVLCVVPEHRGHGMGGACLAYVQANFARVVESAVEYFVRHGYVAIGKMKQGRRLRTQIMVRKDLISLAGRINRIFSTI